MIMELSFSKSIRSRRKSLRNRSDFNKHTFKKDLEKHTFKTEILKET